MLWLLIAAYFAVGFALAVWVSDDEEDIGWASFIFFMWLPLAAMGTVTGAVCCVFMVPALAARFVANRIAKFNR